MLIIEIALGIVLGWLIGNYWPWLIVGAFYALRFAAAMVAVFAVLLGLGCAPAWLLGTFL
jgi:hypothetical protein